MKENELRVGNLVTKEGDSNWYVTDFLTIRLAHNYQPIPLTSELLERCGFVLSKEPYDQGYSFYENKQLELYLDIDMRRSSEGFSLMIDGTDEAPYLTITSGIKSLHELQNLIYALTGEELQFNSGEKVQECDASKDAI